MTEELKRCPKCGYEALMTKSHGEVKSFSVRCFNCNNKTIWYADEAEAVNAWNEASEPETPNDPKRCPFCGGKAKMHHAITHHSSSCKDYYVMCEECLTSGNNYPSEEKAVQAWNRRIYE